MQREGSRCERASDFVSTEIYRKAKRAIDGNKPILILHGLPGSGKTEISKALGEDLRGHGTTYWLLNCSSKPSMDSDLKEHCNKETLNVTFPPGCNPLSSFLKSDASAGRLLILDDVEEVDDVLKTIRGKSHSTKFIVTTQIALPTQNLQIDEESENVLPIIGFTKDEAKRYLKIQNEGVDKLLDNIGLLPIALRTFKGALQTNKADSQEDFIEQYIFDLGKEEEDPAVRCITECLKRALADNTFYEKLLKHVSMFSHNHISVEILVALIEELGESKARTVVNQFMNCLLSRSLCDRTEYDKGQISITLHQLVKKVMESLVKPMEYATTIRVSLQAFSRIMPLDGRNHQYFILPKMLEHGKCLLTKLNKRGYQPSASTKLLKGQLLTSIGYCMISLRHDRTDVINILEEGLEVFLNLLSDHSSRKFEEIDVNELFKHDLENKLLLHDESYATYIGKLQLLYKLTSRDFEEIFRSETYDKRDEKLECGHLTESALTKLSRKGLLLPEDTLFKIYPLELLAFHLQLLSKAYDHPPNNDGRLAKAVGAARKADSIYDLLKQHNAPLLGMYVNRRHLLNLLNLQRHDETETLSGMWKALLEERGRAYECGMIRIYDVKDDEYHQLLCQQGLLQLLGRKANDPSQRQSAIRESKDLIKEIIDLSEKHKRKHITLSKSYQHIAEFYESYRNYHNAISYLIKSMMEYHKYCLESRKGEFGHPELDDVMRKKFDTIYDQLKTCVEKSPEPYHETSGDAKEYLTSMNDSWQKRCQLTQADGNHKYVILLQLAEARGNLEQQTD